MSFDFGPDPEFLGLTRELCGFPSGIVADGNAPLFRRLTRELPFTIHGYRSGEEFNAWRIPDNWRVKKALIYRDGRLVFDGRTHTLGVALYSRSFTGKLDWRQLSPHLVTNESQPDAFMFHCLWPYRPWLADWAFCVPYNIFRTLGPGEYDIDLQTEYEPGEMLVGEFEHRGRSSRTIVFNANTCHPHQANDGFAAVAVLIRLFQWLRTQQTFYCYRLILAPEHFGSVFYMRDRSAEDIERLVSGIFAEMMGTSGKICATSTFLGNQPLDRAVAHTLRHHTRGHRLAAWRCGAGNDETVWEAPGYEVPCVELTRCESQFAPYPQYHSSLDNADLMEPGQLLEFYRVLQKLIETVECNSVVHRKFSGLICLSNPKYDLYMERPDPAIDKQLPQDSEKWGHLVDCLLRFFDGKMSILDMAEKHDLPFDRLYRYIRRFEEKGLVRLEFTPIDRLPISPGDVNMPEFT